MSQLPDFWRSQLSRPLDRFFEEFASPLYRRGDTTEQNKYGFNPQCEVSEDKSHYLMKFDLPGISKDQIKIELHENRLTISGERKEEKKNDTEKQHFSEVYYGSFTRAFTFPSQVDAERVQAKYENGILQIEIPKSESSRARQINVK